MPSRAPQYPRLAACVLLLLTAAVCFAAAPPSALAQASESEDSVQVRRFRLADSYLRAGQYERAIALLEDLHADSPE